MTQSLWFHSNPLLQLPHFDLTQACRGRETRGPAPPHSIRLAPHPRTHSHPSHPYAHTHTYTFRFRSRQVKHLTKALSAKKEGTLVEKAKELGGEERRKARRRRRPTLGPSQDRPRRTEPDPTTADYHRCCAGCPKSSMSTSMFSLRTFPTSRSRLTQRSADRSRDPASSMVPARCPDPPADATACSRSRTKKMCRRATSSTSK